MIAGIVCAALVPLTGTAAATTTAYPIKGAELTANALYDAGALPTSTCEEKKVRRNDRASARAYINGIIACLDSTWEQHLTGAGLTFKKVKVKHVTKVPKRWCGIRTGTENSQVYYCASTGTLMFQLGKSWLDEPKDLWLAHVAAGMYGYHVQNLAGIEKALDGLKYRNRSEYLEQSRRANLQTDCLSAAFLKSVWPLSGRDSGDWKTLVDIVRGDGRGEERWNGKTSSIKAWMRAGFASGDPGSCNTWSAPSSKVA